MNEGIMQQLRELTTKYQSRSQNQIDNNEKEQDKLQLNINKIKDLIEQLEAISEQPELPNSFIPINSLAYVPAAIIHTSEYYVKLGSVTYAYMSLKETLRYLQRKLDHEEECLTDRQLEAKQIKKKFNLVTDDVVTTETEDMPNEITSAMGTAYKTNSGLYEIFEPYNEEEEHEFYKRRHKH